MQPKLSILIPALAERESKLVAELNRQIGDKPVELLVLMDNRKRSTGRKRQALLRLAQGHYLTHLDDDDWVAPDYVDEVLKALNPEIDEAPDVLVFNQECTWNGEGPFVVRCGIEYENEDMHKDPEDKVWQDIHRKPWHWCVWRADLARTASFPDGYIDDDWYWLKQLIPKVKNQKRIEKILHYYRYSGATSASQQGAPTT